MTFKETVPQARVSILQQRTEYSVRGDRLFSRSAEKPDTFVNGR